MLFIDIDQVNNIIFLDKIQEELVVLVVLLITSTLRWIIVHSLAKMTQMIYGSQI